LAQWGGGTLYFTSASAAIFFPSGGISYGTATGGTGFVAGPTGYIYTSFLTDSNLVVTKSGLFDVLLIGGGGGSWNNGGGSGPGGIVNATVYLAAGTYAVDVGAGGATNKPGLSSTIGDITLGLHVAPDAVGGGMGPNNLTGVGAQPTGPGAVGLVPPQNPYSSGASSANAGGGGAGGGGAGGASPSSNVGGAGGSGFDVSTFIGGSALLKAGGGGGGGATTGGAAGSGGGGVGASGAGAAGSGTANTGGGAGGPWLGALGTGGSGIVYVRTKS